MSTRKYVLIACLLLALLLVFFNSNRFSGSRSVNAVIATHNVLQESFQADWYNIKQAIDPEHKNNFYTVTEFELRYSPNGEIQSLSWSFVSPVVNGKQWFYTINRGEEDQTYTILESHSNALPTVYQGQMMMDDFVKLISTKTMQAMNPGDGDGDGVSMIFSQTYQKLSSDNINDMPNAYYVIRDDKAIGPVKQGEGYIMTVFSLHLESGGSLSGEHPRYYFLGGHGDIVRSDPSP